MSVSRFLCSLPILVGLAACSSDPPPAPAAELHAIATAACGPADEPAIEIYLAHAPIASLEPSAPYARIYIWQPLHRFAPRSWSLDPDGGEGGAWFHPTAGDFEIATGGTVTITAVRPGGAIEGSVDVTFPSGARFRGAFRAPWHERLMLCG